MHTLYWRDLESPANGEWLGLAVQVEGAHRAPSFLHLQSGGQARIRLMRGDQPLLWATQLPYHDGIWLVKSLVAASPAQASVPPIDSPTLEALRGLRGEARYKAWSRYFVETLRTSPGSCLEAGRWLLRLSLAEQVPAWQPPQSHDPRERVLERWRYRSVGRDALLPDWRFYSLEKVLDDDWVQWLDWWGRDNDALIALRRVEDDEGRVKWWRKKAREGELPPVLALRLNLPGCLRDPRWPLPAARWPAGERRAGDPGALCLRRAADAGGYDTARTGAAIAGAAGRRAGAPWTPAAG
ncbi:TPA: hypothetical protein SMQ17_001842 [Pseudomonas aeruginosa]|nr:hypothetical protein [Pseudomonas aeruginosa]